MSHSNAQSKGSSRVKRKGQLIQFSPYSTELMQLLERDVNASTYKTKTQYLNALIGRVLSLECRFDSSSRIDELFRILDLNQQLPVQHIRALAPTQHRNFDQMLIHLLQTALSEYPDLTSLGSGVPRQPVAPEKEIASKQTLNDG